MWPSLDHVIVNTALCLVSGLRSVKYSSSRGCRRPSSMKIYFSLWLSLDYAAWEHSYSLEPLLFKSNKSRFPWRGSREFHVLLQSILKYKKKRIVGFTSKPTCPSTIWRTWEHSYSLEPWLFKSNEPDFPWRGAAMSFTCCSSRFWSRTKRRELLGLPQNRP